MQRIAKFHKVSFEQFKADWADAFPDTSEEDIIHIYEGSGFRPGPLPAPLDMISLLRFPLTLAPGESMKVPTGVRAEIDTGWVLQIFPRSSLGFKFRLQLNNTVGIIDSDYFYSDNEGHMFIKVTNDSKEGKTVELGQGAGFAQGIFIPYGITADDECSDVRNGGFGSTDAR